MPSQEITLPRDQTGAHPQSLLTTLLADYRFAAPPGVTSDSIVRLLVEFGISESGARSALTRVVQRDLLERHGTRANIRYQLTPQARSIHTERVSYVVEFGEQEPAWNGEWTVLTPAAILHRAQKRRFTQALKRAGFGHLGESSIHPRQGLEVARDLAAEFEVPAITTRGKTHFDRVAASDAFALDELASDYKGFIASYEDALAHTTRNRAGTSDSLQIRTSALRDWRLLVLRDPNLPSEFLPENWPMLQARKVFATLREKLAEPALEQVRALIDDPLAELDWEQFN